jgi:serine protease
MFRAAGTFNKKKLAIGLLLLALATSGLSPMPDQPTQVILPGPGLATPSQIDPAYSSEMQSGQADVPTDRIIIKYKSTTSAFAAPAGSAQMARLATAGGISMQYLRKMSGNANVLSLPGRLPLAKVQAISKKLMSLPEVEYVVPDQMRFPTLTPNDPLYSNQWDLFESNGINAPAAWDITTGMSSIVIADIDTGITNHADLSGRTVPGYDFISNTLVANDGNGRDADPSDPGDWVAKNECYPGSSASNSSWHGTHTAGTIGANSNNSLGVAGINWNSKILPVRVLGKCGGYDSDIIDGLTWAAGLPVSGVPVNANPAKVLNLSLGGSGACSTAWQGAINAANSAGTVVVVAAGNSNANASGYTPASCNGVITVAATNRSGSRAYYSNFGLTVEISAPGGEQSYSNDPNGILSTLNTGTTVPVSDTYIYYQGTSMAAPHVTGVVSLMFSLNPFLTPTQVLQILQNTARPFPAGSTCSTSLCGSGILDAATAVNAVPASITGFSPISGEVGTSVNISGVNFARVSVVRFNGSIASFTILSNTSINATVPADATTGPISVTNPGGTVASTTSFTVTTPSVTPSITNTPTSTPTSTQTNTATQTFTPASTPTSTSTPTPTFTPTPTSTPTATQTFTLTSTDTFTSTPTSTPTFTYTPSPTFTPTNTNSPTATQTFTLTSTDTFTSTPTSTSTFTYTPSPTFTPTNTNSPTATRTFTPTNTNTFTSTPSSTPTSTYTSTPTFTPTNTNSPTATRTFTPTNTFTSTPSNTSTSTYTPTPTFTPTNTNSPTATRTFTPTNTFTSTPSSTSTSTYTPTPTSTPTATRTFTPANTNTPSFTPNFTFTPTVTFSPTSTPTATSSSTTTPINTSTPAYTPSGTMTSSLTPTYTPTFTSTPNRQIYRIFLPRLFK